MIKPIEDWKTVLLDTSVIIDYITDPERIVDNATRKNKIIDTHKLFTYFDESSMAGKKRSLFISSITLAELRKIESETTIVEYLMNLFNTSEVFCIDFSTEMAIPIHQHIDIPNDKHLNSFIKELSDDLNRTGVYHASGWVSDDLKIVATAKYFKTRIDAVLTGDTRSFLPLAERFEVPVVNTASLPKDLFEEIDVTKSFD